MKSRIRDIREQNCSVFLQLFAGPPKPQPFTFFFSISQQNYLFRVRCKELTKWSANKTKACETAWQETKKNFSKFINGSSSKTFSNHENCDTKNVECLHFAACIQHIHHQTLYSLICAEQHSLRWRGLATWCRRMMLPRKNGENLILTLPSRSLSHCERRAAPLIIINSEKFKVSLL